MIPWPKDKFALGVILAAVFLQLFFGLTGLRWGLPNQSRFSIFSPALLSDSRMPEKLEASWKKIYRGVQKSRQEDTDESMPRIQGAEEFKPGWVWPPGNLVHSYRSILLRSQNPDEQKTFTILAQMDPAHLKLKPIYIQYGGFFVYSCGILLELLAHLKWIHLSRSLSFYLINPSQMARFYIVGRALMFFSTMATLIVIFDIGRRLSGERMGSLAALFFVLSPAIVANSHVLKPHPYAAFWALLSVDAAVMALETESARALRFCGVFAGLAAGSNLSFFYFGFLPLIVWVWRGGSQKLFSFAWQGTLLSFLAFSLSNPYLFIDPGYYVWELLVYPRHKAGFSLHSTFLFLTSYFPEALGYALTVAAFLGFVLDLKSESKKRFFAVISMGGLLLLWFLLMFVWGFLNSSASVRFFYPFLGLFSLLAAEFFVSERVPSLLKRLFLPIVLLFNFLICFVYVKNLDLNDGDNSTRYQSALWIEKNIKPGQSIGLSRYPQPYSTPLVRYDQYRLVVFERPDFLKRFPEYMVLDQEGYSDPKTRAFVKKNYHLAAAFKPFSLGPFSMDPNYYINTAIRIFQLKDQKY
jgi:hypothetical protein